MKLRKLEIVGFKSFVDRTLIKFDHDVTGVVGPNGCGKSNIVDAIRWCMGEQSAKHLRGRGMEDVIFNGSESRGPHGFAEVTLTFDNNDGLAPVEYRDYPEIAVTRRLYRGGDGEYLINKTQVRLKDVTDLFLGTGAGTKAYAIVEQGKIGLIVSSKPEDRRVLIEEAAGITKYKSKRKQAERKIELTQQNLLRVGDIITELEKSLASLKRQAAKAERYMAYRAELDDLILHEAAHKYLGLIVTRKYFDSALEGWVYKAQEARSALLTRETELETLRLAAFEAERKLEAVQTAHFGADNEARALEAEIVRARDQFASLRSREIDASRELAGVSNDRRTLVAEEGRFRDELAARRVEEDDAHEALAIDDERLQEATARQQEADRKLDELRRQVAAIGARIASAEAALKGHDRRKTDVYNRKERLALEYDDLSTRQIEVVARADELRRSAEDLRSGKATYKERREELEGKLATLRREVIDAEKVLDHDKHELAKARSRMQALLEIQSRLEGVGLGVRAVIHKRDLGVSGMLADLIDAPSHLTQALAALLGDDLQALVVSNLEKAIELAAWLRDERKGRAVFLPRDAANASGVSLELPLLPEELTSGAEPRVLGFLFNLVSVQPDDVPLVRLVLGDAIVVRDVEAARLVIASFKLRGDRAVPSMVTIDGEVFYGDGRVAAGAREQVVAGFLDSKRETRELSHVVARLDAAVSELVGKHQALRAAIAETQAALDAARQAEHKGELALLTADKDLRAAEIDIERGRRRLEQLVGERDELAAQLAEIEEEYGAAREDLARAGEDKEAIERQRDDAQREADAQREELDARRANMTERKVQLARAREKKRAIEGALERLSRSSAELSERESRLEGELREGARKQGELGGAMFAKRERLLVASAEVARLAAALASAKGEYDTARSAMGVHEAELKALRQRAEGAEQERVAHDMRCRELTLELKNLLEGVRARFRGLDLPRVIGDYHLRPIPGEEHAARIDELAGLIDRMGAVNLDAKREHDEASVRHTNFVAQKADLDKAIADLQKAIEQMDRESRKLFKETFDAVNERFQALFPSMFRGGKAMLMMTQPDDLLETGIDIAAQPPGKKIGNIELMSGGEKALTAVSLIFAMFQIRPSPFCILDEVDAPLDEANVARYNEAIRSMTDRSQFILITHIKRAMQMVDVLYGVTMPEPGVSSLTSVDLTTIDKKISAGGKAGGHGAVA